MPLVEPGQGSNRKIVNLQFVRALGVMVEVGDKDRSKQVTAAINAAAEAAGYKKTDGYTPEVAKAMTAKLKEAMPDLVMAREVRGKFAGTELFVGAEAKNPTDGNYARIAIDDDDARYIVSFSVANEGGAVGNRVATGLAASVKGLEAKGLGKGTPIAFAAFPSEDKDEQGNVRKNERTNQSFWGFSSLIKLPGADGKFGRDSGETVVETKGLWPDLKALRDAKKEAFAAAGLSGKDLTSAVRKEETKALIANFYKPTLSAHPIWTRDQNANAGAGTAPEGGSDEDPAAQHQGSPAPASMDMDDDIPF